MNPEIQIHMRLIYSGSEIHKVQIDQYESKFPGKPPWCRSRRSPGWQFARFQRFLRMQKMRDELNPQVMANTNPCGLPPQPQRKKLKQFKPKKGKPNTVDFRRR